jgi:hypothetical protein
MHSPKPALEIREGPARPFNPDEWKKLPPDRIKPEELIREAK